MLRGGHGDQLFLRVAGGVGAAVLQGGHDVLEAFAHGSRLGEGQVGVRVRVRHVGIEAAHVGRGEGLEGLIRDAGDTLGQGVGHLLRGVVPDVVIAVVQLHRGAVVIGIVPFGLLPLQLGRTGDPCGVGMEGNIDAAEALRGDLVLQAVIRAEALLQHFPILFKALVPRDAEGGDGIGRGDLAAGLVQHHGRTAIAAEGGGGRVHRVDGAATVGAGEQVHLHMVARLAGFPPVGGLDRLSAVAHAAFQLLPRRVKDHGGAASRTTVQGNLLLCCGFGRHYTIKTAGNKTETSRRGPDVV